MSGLEVLDQAWDGPVDVVLLFVRLMRFIRRIECIYLDGHRVASA